MEDLGDHRRLLGVGHEPGLGLAGLGAGGDGVRAVLEAVAVGGAAAAAEALQRGLAHAALGLARELLPLVLVEGLLQGDHQPPSAVDGVARADRVVDLHPDLAQLAVKQPGRDPVAREARGLVDHDGVEAARCWLAGLLGQRRPAGAVVLGARLLVEELDDDLAAELGGLASASLELRGPRERLVLLVVGRQAAVEREALHHQQTPRT